MSWLICFFIPVANEKNWQIVCSASFGIHLWNWEDSRKLNACLEAHFFQLLLCRFVSGILFTQQVGPKLVVVAAGAHR